MIKRPLSLKEVKRSFYIYDPDPVYMVFDAIMNYDKEQAEKFLVKLTIAGGEKVDEVLKQEIEGKTLLTFMRRNWLPV